MNTMVFRCPGCMQPFQVMAEQAGQMVRCPGCQTTVQIPATAPAPAAPQAPAYVPPAPVEKPQEPDFNISKRSGGGNQLPAFQFPPEENVQREPEKPAENAEPYDCPECRQAFGIYPSMIGTQMMCPHCEATVSLRPKSERPAVSAPTPPQAPEKSQPVKNETTSERSQPWKSQSSPKQKKTSEPKTRTADVTSHAQDEQQVEKSQKDSGSEKVKLSRSERRKTSREPKTAPRPGQFRSVEDLLPPKFRALDPEFFYRRHQDGAQVMLPSSDGEVKVVDNRIVKIEHNGQTYELISSPEYDRVQKAIVTNVLAVLICGLVIAIVMTLLNG